MRTPEELSKEVLQKIEKRKAERLKTRKAIKKIACFTIIFGFFVPMTVWSVQENIQKNRPLSKPYEEQPLPPEDKDSTTPGTPPNGDGSLIFDLFV